MTRAELETQIRLLTLVESTNVSDANIRELINEALRWVDGVYPLPVTIIDLSASDDSPAFADAYHWIVSDYVQSKLYEREEYYDEAEQKMASASGGVRQLVKFYTGGRT